MEARLTTRVPITATEKPNQESLARFIARIETMRDYLEDIHRVTNVGTDTAISIHVYGADIGKLGSSINHVFDGLPIVPGPKDARRVAWRLRPNQAGSRADSDAERTES